MLKGLTIHNQRHWRSWILGFALCLCAAQAAAGHVLKVATGEWPPYLSAELPGYGCVAVMVKDAFESEGYQVEYHFLPWSRGYAKTKQGHYDVNMYWFRSKQRERDFLLSKNNISLERLGFYYLKSLGLQGDSYAEFQGKTLVLNPGFTYPDELWKQVALNGIEVIEARTEVQNFELMAKGRAHATVLSEKVAQIYIDAMDLEGQAKVLSSETLQGFLKGHVLFSRGMNKDAETVRVAFDRGFEKLMSDAEYRYNYQKNCSQF